MVFPNPPAILTQRQLSASELTGNSQSAWLRLYAWMFVARTADNSIFFGRA
jgi:2-oxoisovalerate dehydrogenase E1 component